MSDGDSLCEYIDSHIRCVTGIRDFAYSINIAAQKIKHSKTYICGNGGSAADAQHFAAELTGRYIKERLPLPAVALTTDTSAITAIGNDYGFEYIFSRQVEALCAEGDTLVVISTSGNSENIIKAIEAAKKAGVFVIALTGGDGGKIVENDYAGLTIIAPSNYTPHIQEAHIMIIHMICELIDHEFQS